MGVSPLPRSPFLPTASRRLPRGFLPALRPRTSCNILRNLLFSPLSVWLPAAPARGAILVRKSSTALPHSPFQRTLRPRRRATNCISPRCSASTFEQSCPPPSTAPLSSGLLSCPSFCGASSGFWLARYRETAPSVCAQSPSSSDLPCKWRPSFPCIPSACPSPALSPCPLRS